MENMNTPRTDAKYKDHEWDIMDHIPLEFCRQLELELNASLENQVKSMEKLVEQQDFTLKAAALLSKAVSQRDRAIKIAEIFQGEIGMYDPDYASLDIIEKEFEALKSKIK